MECHFRIFFFCIFNDRKRDIPQHKGLPEHTYLDNELLKEVTKETRANNANFRNAYERKPLFRIYPMPEPAPLEHIKLGSPFLDPPCAQIFVRTISFFEEKRGREAMREGKNGR